MCFVVRRCKYQFTAFKFFPFFWNIFSQTEKASRTNPSKHSLRRDRVLLLHTKIALYDCLECYCYYGLYFFCRYSVPFNFFRLLVHFAVSQHLLVFKQSLVEFGLGSITSRCSGKEPAFLRPRLANFFSKTTQCKQLEAASFLQCK